MTDWSVINSYTLFASVTAEVISFVFIAELGKNKRVDLTNFRNYAAPLHYSEGFERGLFLVVEMASPLVSYRNKSYVGCSEEYLTAPVADIYRAPGWHDFFKGQS